MRRAIVSDIHGDIQAIENVLEDINQQHIQSICCVGDVVGYGKNPLDCIEAAMRFEFCLLGNVDQAVLFDAEDNGGGPPEPTIRWTREQLTQSDRTVHWDFLCQLPRRKQIADCLFVHGSARYPINEYVFPEDVHDSEKMQTIFSLIPRHCFQGHTHIPGVFTDDGRFLLPSELPEQIPLGSQKAMINVGSVSLPRDGDPRACYVIWDDQCQTIQFRRVQVSNEKSE